MERGSKDSDWDPVKDAARKLAFVEDRAIFEGYAAASIEGIRQTSSNPALALSADAREIPDTISQALSELRLAGVDGPYSVLLSAQAYTSVSDTTEHGYPILQHINRLIAGDRRCVRADHPRRRLSTSSWAPTCRSAISATTPTHRRSLPRGDAHVPVAHRRGIGRIDGLVAIRLVARRGTEDCPDVGAAVHGRR